ncbi:MAG: TAT-variant-translocated molybdopterin oxidoreductase [Pirellulales bacterium]|nr:TAT-variant-translocated molybdopterin oxidoreductase [Pirellulales bacterium]
MADSGRQTERAEKAVRHWRSLAELADAPEYRAFLEAEFPREADPGGISRRRWLQLMGASLTLASVGGGCRWEQEEILPMVRRPAHRVPGEPQRFATAMDLRGAALGLLVTSVDGRPIKIEGNPDHPQSRGATDALAQASILQLYDPDRSGKLVQGTAEGESVQTWDKFVEFASGHFGPLRKDGGRAFRVLAETTSSPTLAAMRSRLLEAFPEAKWYEYEPLSRDNERAGTKLAFGKVYRPHYHLDRAKVIVAIDEDLFCDHPAGVQYARAFADGRTVVNGQMNRLYAIECCYTPTGAAADHRLPLRAQDIAVFVAALEREITGGSGSAHGKDGESDVGRFVVALAKDLKARRGETVVAVGPRQPAEVHAAAHRINAALGNIGNGVVYFPEPDADRMPHRQAIAALASEMNAGKVETLLVLGGNPVYNAPADLDFAAALGKVRTTVHLGLYRDETALLADWHLPQAHFLESWGDARSWDGTYSIVQPLIAPLLGGKPAIELLALVLGDEKSSGMELVRATFQRIAGAQNAQTPWRETVHDGLLQGSGWSPEKPAIQGAAPQADRAASLSELVWKQGPLEIVFCGDSSVYDGRFANNAWLQETPDPITKLTWDNAAWISPATAAALGVENETMVRLKLDGRELVMPAYILPGQAAGSVAVGLGYGRSAAGFVGGDARRNIQSIGFDTYRLRPLQAQEFATGLAIEPTGEKYRLATTQDHHAIDTVGLKARAARVGALVRSASLEHYQEHPEFARHAVHHPPLISLFDEPEYPGRRWGMSIDVSKCIGCNACVVACQAENNVPVVGKERVLEGREMHWIRIDRYFVGEPDRAQVDHQVMICQHCENAPCEQVCPVAATVHSSEGLNDMVYNRCVGTRYCSNNCPYKVRRFNFFNYHKNLDRPGGALTKMVYNPDVTVRSRGVMEKCTYCVQRIQEVKIRAKNQRREIRDGEIKTACQQACPSQAIVFGDLSDKSSRVARDHAADRSYGVLAELNTKPRTAYLAKIRNPNPELEDAHHVDDHPAG